MKPILVSLVSATLVTLPSLSSGATADWPQWRGPDRDGKSPDTGLLERWPEGGPQRLWQHDGIGKGYSSVAVARGTVYITGVPDDKLVLTALDLDGERKWSVDIDQAWTNNYKGGRATPTIEGGRLYLLSGRGRIGCYDARNGREIWTRQTSEFGGRPGGWGYAESILILGKLAICKPGGEKCVVALDKSTGRTLWTSTGFKAGPEYGSCLPVRVGRAVTIVTGTREGVAGFDARSGRKLWSDDWSAHNTANCPTPVTDGPYVFWANGYGKGGVCIRQKLSGRRLVAERAWTTRDMNCHHGGYVVHEGHIYGNNGGGWACLELATGEVKWEERGVGKGSVCWADGMLYLFSERKGRAALATCSPDGLELRGEVSVDGSGPSWAHPVVVGGRLYLRYDDHLYCFDVKKR